MTNEEVRNALEEILSSATITEETLSMMLDAAIHACLISKKKSLSQLSAEFMGMCIGHNMLASLLGPESFAVDPTLDVKGTQEEKEVDHNARAQSILDAAFKPENGEGSGE